MIVVLGLIPFRYFGRSIWKPLKDRITGAQTVEKVIRSLDSRMASVFPNLPELTTGRIALIGLKQEKQLEVWHESAGSWLFVKQYPFTAFSGTLGPKLHEGDGQIPEGSYRITSLNPNSSYHLSMELDYPNPFDRERGAQDGRTSLGNEIFIHGKDVTIGCIPIGDAGIEELFYLVAKTGIENVEVIIAPFDFRRVNDVRAIQIEEIDWELSLYQDIKTSLARFKRVVENSDVSIDSHKNE